MRAHNFLFVWTVELSTPMCNITWQPCSRIHRTSDWWINDASKKLIYYYIPKTNENFLSYNVYVFQDVDMKSHGSVITHLLSQVRIGMDLTKIVLPTFILERRSLLEMYSDFFAHPDIFLEIVDGKDPEERMILVLRWYLSSFHAGRKSTVAKKPYNPILVKLSNI